MKTVRQLALKDISEDFNSIPYNELYTVYTVGDVDSWYVSATMLDTKENRRLNKLLGLEKVNYFGDKMNRKLITKSGD